jgi:FliI/YscN family ATPase
LQRLKGAFAATAIAEHFRDQGANVILMMDSVTRFAMAQREVGLAIGEPPATKGYTPSVFALLPKLLERAGTAEAGSITALYTVLVEGDDTNEPISDTVRGILDGHIVLSRELAAQNHYPAIDVLGSVSRVMTEIVPPGHLQAAGGLRELLAVYREARDLINIGAYQHGSNPQIDRAIALVPKINAYLRQGVHEPLGYAEAIAALQGLGV